jgi:hypothetical protein
MANKKRKGRIRQTRTEWQKVFDPHPRMIQPFSWSDRLPEFIHISIALIDHDYQTVKGDFYTICDFINSKVKMKRRFHFNLTHTIELIKSDTAILDKIFETVFKDAFHNILTFYHDLFQIPINFEFKANPKLLFLGYRQILDGRADTSILCKYLMVQYQQHGRQDPFGHFNWQSKEEILEPMNVSSIMALFPPSVGLSENLDLEKCQEIWMYNYVVSPLLPKPDDSKMEEEHYTEMAIHQFKEEFEMLYNGFKELNLLAIYPTFIAEVNMGFVARICNLSLDAVDFVKNHKGEIAEMVFRTTLETFIVASWLLKRKDIELHKRFREYSTGRERFFGQQLAEKAPTKDFKKEADKMVTDAIKQAGVREIEVATERGDIFNLRIDQMADEVWGVDNQYYFLYKRSSEVIHGHWRVIAKYHLAKSFNPMHNGLYWYNENPNRFAGLIPAFICLQTATEFLITILNDIQSEQTKELQEKLIDYRKRLLKQYMVYFNKYIMPAGNGDNESAE